MLRDLVNLIRSMYDDEGFIHLHPAYTTSNGISNMNSCYRSGNLSRGRWGGQFERALCDYTGARFCILTNSGTSALHLALLVAGIELNDHIITQDFTYIATANAIIHTGARPVFIDINRDHMSMSVDHLNAAIKDIGKEYIQACVPMLTLGNKGELSKIREICELNKITLIVDGCQAIMTPNMYEGITTCLSFNGNKPITTGGGGAILTDDPNFEMTARMYMNQIDPVVRPWYNYRMPNINAAIGCGAMDFIEHIKKQKERGAKKYHMFAEEHGLTCPTPNFPWLNALLVDDQKCVQEYLSHHLIESRLGFPLIHEMNIYEQYPVGPGGFVNAKYICDHIIMLPSGVPIKGKDE